MWFSFFLIFKLHWWWYIWLCSMCYLWQSLNMCCFSDIVNSIQLHSSRPIILCLSGGRVFATWLCSGQCLARVVIWVFLEVTEQGFRVWHWFMHVYERLFKCVHIVIFYNFTRLLADSSSSCCDCNIFQIIWVT